MREGERQVAPTIDGIRADHVARYKWAAELLPKNSNVLDYGCGIGYGSNILASCGHVVSAYDIDAEAIDYAEKHYTHPGAFFFNNVDSVLNDGDRYDAAIAFEVIEHIEDPATLLKQLRKQAKVLLASVPNEEVFAWNNHAYHYRHYTRTQFNALLKECGWHVTEWHGQEDAESGVEPGVNGRTVIVKAVPADPAVTYLPEFDYGLECIEAPKHVAIVGLGPSVAQYVDLTKRLGGRSQLCDQTWVINALGNVLDCDLIFHMDDVRIQEARGAAMPDSNIAAMVKWLKTCEKPVLTSRPHPDYPTSVAFPLADVLSMHEFAYFNSTAAYAVAYAIYLGVEKISLYGVDFTYPNSHDAEKGRACVEFWLGIAAAKGIKLSMPKTSSLMDALHSKEDRLYGYDTVEVEIGYDENGKTYTKFLERVNIPTAEEIEERYDHSVHPNALVEA